MRESTRWTAVLLALWFLTGCVDLDRTIGQIGAKHNSYDLEGERIEFQMLTLDQLKGLRDGNNQPLKTAGLEALLTQHQAGLVDLGIPELVKFGYQIIEEQVKKEQARYEEQFSSTVFAPSFWKDAGHSSATYAGFIIRRRITASDAVNGTAFVLVCGLVPIQKGTFLEVLPLYLDIQRPKAKIVGRYDILKITLTETSQWVDDKGMHDDTLSTINWELSGGFDLEKSPLTFNEAVDSTGTLTNSQIAGAIAAPPTDRMADSTGKVSSSQSGGLATLKLTVDEKDATEAAAITKDVETLIESTDKNSKQSGSTSPTTTTPKS